jgi:bifunctional UDP-N-acetylglucosamine 2-epimerase / N-acetylmannosamine kinase
MLSKKIKICVVITARPSYSRIRSVLFALKNSPNFDLKIILAASALLDRFGKVEDIVEKDGFEVAAKLHMVVETDNDPSGMGITTGLGIIQLSQLFSTLKPEAVITIADRYETLATAVAASYAGITLVHLQGGEITGNIDERVRHAITKLADVHFPASKEAKNIILRMGENPEFVFEVGCPSLDLINSMEIIPKDTLQVALDTYGVGHPVSVDDAFLIAMLHPVTTDVGSSEIYASQLLDAVHKINIPCVWFWPNVDAGSSETSRAIRKFRENNPENNIRFIKNLDPEIFISLLKKSVGLVGNSSVGIRECSFLGVPVVNIGSRQRGRQRGSNVDDVGYDVEEIVNAIRKMTNLNAKNLASNIYGSGNSAQMICQILSEITFPREKFFNKD